MIHASAKNVVRMAIAIGAFALLALVAMPDAQRSAADENGGGTPTPTPAPKSVLDFDPNGKLAVPASTPQPDLDGEKIGGYDDLSPAIFGADKRAPVYANLEASLEGAAVLATAGADGIGVDSDKTADLVADAVSKTPLNDGADAVAVSVYAESDISDAKRFLENRGVRVDYSGETWFEAYVPARLLGALSERPGVIRVEPIVPPVVDRMPLQTTPDPCAATDLSTLAVTDGAGSVSRSGSWASTCVSSTRTGSYSRFYTFAIAKDSVFEYVRVETTGGSAVEPFAYLRSGTATSGDAIAEYLETGTDRRIGNVALDAGTYTVEATTLRAGDSGDFTLSMAFSEPTICAADATIGTISTSTVTTKTGTWTTSCDSGGHDGSAQHYQFTLSQAAAMTIDLTTTTDADPVLYLRKDEPMSGANTFGRDYIARDDNGAGGTDARIIRALAAGTYTIEAAAADSADNKAFSLALTSELATICRETLDISTSPATQTASWADGCDSATNARSYARYYTFTLSADSEVAIELDTPDATTPSGDSAIVPKVDARLYLRSGQNTAGATVAESDDISEIPLSTDSRIERTLDAGEYTVEATTHIPKTAGSFTLTVTYSAARSGCAPTSLGTLADSAPTLTANGVSWPSCDSAAKTDSKSAYYGFTLSNPGMVEISLTSSAAGADPYLYLRDGARNFGTAIASDNDGGTGDAALIRRSLEAGSYTIEATNQSATASGTFDLSATLITDCRIDLGTLGTSSNVDVSGTWLTGCPSAARTGKYARFYTFRLASVNRANISLESEYADTYMYLRSGEAESGAHIAEDDDVGWGYTDSFISESLTAGGTNRGRYTIEATTLYSRYGAGKPFRISINLPNDCAPVTAFGVLESATIKGGKWGDDCSSRARIARSSRFYTFSLKERTEVDIWRGRIRICTCGTARGTSERLSRRTTTAERATPRSSAARWRRGLTP